MLTFTLALIFSLSLCSNKGYIIYDLFVEILIVSITNPSSVVLSFALAIKLFSDHDGHDGEKITEEISGAMK